MISDSGKGFQKGKVSIFGFRRPDALAQFKQVTMLGALLQHSLMFQIWESLGSNSFRRS